MLIGDYMDNKMYFIKTTDEDTAKRLREAGFEELPKEGNHWIFLNNTSQIAGFSSDGLKMNFSNIISV